MPYFQRGSNGMINSLQREKDDKHTEFLAPTHPEIISFLTASKEQHGSNKAKETLSESDQDFARATEDVINLLIEKNIILFTDLPPQVQAKMAGREKLRSNLHNSPYNFLDNSDSI
jgi:hypothetical protein